MLDLTDALKIASDEKADPIARATAIRTLTLAPFADVKVLLAKSLGVRQPQPVQLAALESLGVERVIFEEWSDVVESGVTFEENALLKARFIAQQTGVPAIAELRQ